MDAVQGAFLGQAPAVNEFDEAVGASGEGNVHVDADQVPQGGFGIGDRPCPVVRLLE
ncbi:hypothetical protein [Streptomyces bobili]|uniref:hypothetical protein n=1 Tax=Streptomyces bobili TaxID=67280 RepID=UPI003F4E205C